MFRTLPFPRLLLRAGYGTAALLLASPMISAAHAEERATVAAVQVSKGEIHREVGFDAELRPYQEVEIHARVTGYLESLKVDAGDIVKEGQLLAVLDVPELKIEIENALATERRSQAEVERARAAYDETHLNLTRITKTSQEQPKLIAQQELDAAAAKDRAGAAALDSATEQANATTIEVKKLRTMADYTQITAPFAGVITKRYSDAGALIQAGTSSGTVPLLRLSENDRLRVVFPVSVSYVSSIKVGDPMEVKIESLDRTISGQVARLNKKVETATRTMDVEMDLENSDLSLIPGIYATAVVKMQRHDNATLLPVEAISRDKNGAASVYLITKENKIEERPVKLGVETPTQVEALSGVEPGDTVMVGSRTQAAPGQTVEVKMLAANPVAKTEGAH